MIDDDENTLIDQPTDVGGGCRRIGSAGRSRLLAAL
jgi:hypothetical protein